MREEVRRRHGGVRGREATYIDAGVLITAFRGEAAAARRALEVLDDPNRTLVISDYLQLEVLPKPIFYNRQEEVEFVQTVIDVAENVSHSDVSIENVMQLAANHGLSAMDAFHVGSALVGRVHEIVTTEKTTSPMCRVTEVTVTSLGHTKEKD